jgi:hypothetical protein
MAVLLLLGAIAADAAGEHALAFYLVLTGVALTAHAALLAYGRLVELPGNAPALAAARLQSALGALALALLLVAAAVRAPAVGDGVVPALGLSALVGSLALLVLAGAVRLVQR